MPLESRTRATLRSAEFGFLGVIVLTCRHTPRFCGQPCMAGCFGLRYCWRRGFRTSWLIVGMDLSRPSRPWDRQLGVTARATRKTLGYNAGTAGSRAEA